MKLFLCGDVMTGRGIDQIMPHPGNPVLFEHYLRSASDYVSLAKVASGPIPRAVRFDYIWGDALAEIERRGCDARIINLETAVTAGGKPEPKGINYRMHPANLGCIQAAAVDCCVLANNHIGDWGLQGVEDTLEALAAAGIHSAGAGLDRAAAMRPATIGLPRGRRILVFALASPSSGVPDHWAATSDRPGVNFLPDFDSASAGRAAASILEWRQPDDLVVVSIHWGGNWGYYIPPEHRRFAHMMIETAGVDIVHGHSSHHPMGIEVFAGKPVLYGCGDFINDYEGISGHELFHPDLALAYFVEFDESRGLAGLSMVPFRISRFKLSRIDDTERRWLLTMMQRECGSFGHEISLSADGALVLQW